MKAVVLSGGGSKGSYQIGVWMALRKLNINYDIVCGTSVGALNGALMVQDSFYKAILLWKKVDMKLLFGNNVNNSTTTKDIISLYGKNIIKNHGMDAKGLENVIDKYINTKKFFNSKIDFGLVTINATKKEVVQLKKKDIKEDKLNSYLMASAACFPAFQTKDIDGSKYIDGGYFDNLPINLAIELGADEIIAVDLKAPGFKAKVNKDVKITTISPNNKLSNFLKFSEEGTVKNIKYGYNDTMKKFNIYHGIKYTFKDKKFNRNLSEITDYYLEILKKVTRIKSIQELLKLIPVKNDNLILKEMESLGHLFKIDDTKVYSIKRFNKILLKRFKNNKNMKEVQEIKNIIDNIENNNYQYVKKIGLIKPKILIDSIYIYLLKEV